MPECWNLGVKGDGVRATNERMHALVGGLSAVFAGATGIKGLTVEGPPPGIADDIPDYPPEGYMIEGEEVVDPEYPDEGPQGARIPAEILELRLPLCQAIYEQRARKVYGEEPGAEGWADGWQAFVDFVALARKLEDEGRKPWIYASY